MTLPEFLAQLERRAAEAEAVGATAPVAAVYRTVVAELAPLVRDGGVPAGRKQDPDRLLTVEQVAERLHTTVQWVYRNARRLPFTQHLGRRTLRFSERGLERHLAASRGTP